MGFKFEIFWCPEFISFRHFQFAIGLIFILCACGGEQQASNKEKQSVSSVPLQSIIISPAEVELRVGQSLQLTAMLADESGNLMPKRKVASSLKTGSGKQTQTIGDKLGRTGFIVTWSSSQPSRVKVDEGGLITALDVGVVTINAKSEGVSAVVNITVSEPQISQINIKPSRAELLVGETLQLTAISQNEGEHQIIKPITWSSDDPSSLMVTPTGLAKTLSTGSVTVTAQSEGKSGSSMLTVSPAPTIYGLDFPGNAGVNKTMRFEFTEPLNAYPATYIWRAYPRQQASYYTAFFWGNNGPFYKTSTYYGFHPYPDWNSSRLHFWEIAAPPGGDYLNESNIDYDRWYTQVAICNQSGNKTEIEFYWDWPDTGKVVKYEGVQYNDPSIPVLVFGDAPWNQGHEVWNGVLRGFQFYNTAMSLSEIEKEVASPAEELTPWYLNLNPTPEDIADKSGKGHHPSWVGSERPVLWSGKLIGGSIIKNTVSPYEISLGLKE
jgi:hypothetical protein